MLWQSPLTLPRGRPAVTAGLAGPTPCWSTCGARGLVRAVGRRGGAEGPGGHRRVLAKDPADSPLCQVVPEGHRRKVTSSSRETARLP